MALTAYQEKPKTVRAVQFTGDAASAASVTNDLQAAGSDVQVAENPRVQGSFFALYGKRMAVDADGNETTQTGVKRVRLRTGDYLLPKGPNSCTVMRQAEFEAQWEPKP